MCEEEDIAKHGKVNKQEIHLLSMKWSETGSAATKYEQRDEEGISFFNQDIMELLKLWETQASKDVELDYLDQKRIEYNEKKRGDVQQITMAVTAIKGLKEVEDNEYDDYRHYGAKHHRVSIGSHLRTSTEGEGERRRRRKTTMIMTTVEMLVVDILLYEKSIQATRNYNGRSSIGFN